MKAEIICIGTELLLGDVINTNAGFLGKELSSIGIDLFFVTTVGDNKKRVIKALELASERADLIITSGGLGPTEDDLTHECIADFLGVEQVFHQEIADRLIEIFKSRGREMVKSNLKQAYLPHGTDILPNRYGTAPGIIFNKNGKIILTFPGVPSELKDMWNSTAKPYLIDINPEKSIIKSRILHFAGMGESAIAEKVSDLLNLSNPTVAPLAGKGEVVLRVTAKAENADMADTLIKPVSDDIINRLDKYYYGSDTETLTSLLIKSLIEKNQTVAVAESFTGGLISSRMNSEVDSTKCFKLGLVCHGREMNTHVLGISDFSDLQNVAVKMAEKVRELANSDWGIGVMLAGVDTTDEVFVAVASDNKTEVKKLNYSGWKREDIQFITSQAALNLLRLNFAGN